MNESSVQGILNAYELGGISGIRFLGNAGGFSGARLWRVECDRGTFCLRQWPKNSEVDILEIHRVLMIAHHSGIPVAAPITRRDKRTLTQDTESNAWELAPWVAGMADFNVRPSVPRMEDAVATLARFHSVTARESKFGTSPGLRSRLDYLGNALQISESVQRRLGTIGGSVAGIASELLPRLRPRFQPLQAQLRSVVDRPLQIVHAIRDIHHDHLFYAEERLTGIVDFGSMKEESRCFDLARMVGSLRIDGEIPWEISLNCYSQINELQAEERDLVLLLHQCNLVLGILNWLSWIFLDGRKFEDWNAVESRINQLGSQLIG